MPAADELRAGGSQWIRAMCYFRPIQDPSLQRRGWSTDKLLYLEEGGEIQANQNSKVHVTYPPEVAQNIIEEARQIVHPS